jgi:hypothetical protein
MNFIHEPNRIYLEDELQTEIRRLNLDNNVVLEGFHQNIDAYYQNASVYLSTSAYEGFPMALMESKIFGLPCVMYDLPYLEVSRDPMGLIVVPQGNIKEAAESIIRLLIQENERRNLGWEARESAKRYSNTAVIQAWVSLLKEMENPPTKARSQNDIDIMLQTIIEHFRLGSKKRLCQGVEFEQPSSPIIMKKARTVINCFQKQGYRGVWKLVTKKLDKFLRNNK